MEKLIIFALLALGSAISSYFQNKKKREEEAQNQPPTPRRTAGEPPVPHWPKTGRDWQEELRRVLEGRPAPGLPPKAQIPPTPPPIAQPGRTVFRTPARPPEPEPMPNPLIQSKRAYARAEQMPSRVGTRLEAVERETERAKPAAPMRRSPTAGSIIMRRWTQNRGSLREAFVASLIFAPPVALRED